MRSSKLSVCPFMVILSVPANDCQNSASDMWFRSFSWASLRTRVFLEADSSSKSIFSGFTDFTVFVFLLICLTHTRVS